MEHAEILSREFGIAASRVDAVIGLLDAGNTIPFIARYRKEATGSLDDQLLRQLAERLEHLRSLDRRRAEIEKSLEEQGALTPALKEALASAGTLTAMEDLYRPYRPKKRTRAMIARERGLEPLAALLRLKPDADPRVEARRFVVPEKGVGDVDAALAGARDIIAEAISDDAEARGRLRVLLAREGSLATCAAREEDSVYSMYYGRSEPAASMPAHRILAMNRGEREGFLKVTLQVPDERALSDLKRAWVQPGTRAAEQLSLACEDAWSRLLGPSLERELRSALTDRANEQAIRVFAQNLHQLLMQPPIRGRTVLGVDPGFRTGCKLAVVDPGGRVLETGVGHFTLPGQEAARARSAELIRGMIRRHGVSVIAIGNGTAGRESEQFIAGLLKELPGVGYLIVSEAGASVYSASREAAEEFPQYDLTLRSAISIARRIQDPLAELVKIEPRAIGVGQYQHDLKQSRLEEALDGVTEQCVNEVGVEVATASAALLSRVAGIGPSLAKNIVRYREENGIPSRAALKKIPKLGPRAFEQCAGFLRVSGSREPLDATGVHPESYPAARALMETLGYTRNDLRNGGLPDVRRRAREHGTQRLAERLGIGLPTLNDILGELERPGRDPRDELPKPVLRTDVLSISDLKPGMELTGTVRNVIDFGAFVDIGVHQDGLVHVSRMADRFIRDPSDVVSVGDVVKVWVVDVDEKKKRISLTMVRDKR